MSSALGCNMVFPRKPLARKRLWYLFALLVTIALGLASRRFPNLLPSWLGKYPGDALWALMVFWGFGLLFPTLSSIRIAVFALAFSYEVEFLKLLQTPWLANVRHTTFGHIVFGHVFSWQNLIAYAVGVALGTTLEFLINLRPLRNG